MLVNTTIWDTKMLFMGGLMPNGRGKRGTSTQILISTLVFFFGAHWGNLDELFYYIEKKGVHLSPVNH